MRTILKVNKSWPVQEIVVTSEKDIITGTKKLGMTANVDSDGRLATGIHSVRGQEYPEGSITVRTKADDPDPSPTKHSGSGATVSRSKYYGDGK